MYIGTGSIRLHDMKVLALLSWLHGKYKWMPVSYGTWTMLTDFIYYSVLDLILL